MPRLSWNEITARAGRFADDWVGETYEKGESQSFWTEFLEAFGVNRRRAGGYFEYGVKLAGKKYGFVDMLLPGKLLAEQKSAGRDLTKASTQAFSYLDGLDDHDLPQAIVVSDFATFQHIDLDTRVMTEFAITDLPKHVRLFAPLVEEKSQTIEEASPVNRLAAERMAQLHNVLEASGYVGHKLQLFLVRLVFCLFAEDSGIFESGQFQSFIRNRTSSDGANAGPMLTRLFDVLNTPLDERSATLDEDLAAFRYVNGSLFSEITASPDFDTTMRFTLLMACKPDWAQVSPAIFGAMFQGVMDEISRHDLGAHYTSEENILRVIKPLFLDRLYAEFEAAKSLKRKETKATVGLPRTSARRPKTSGRSPDRALVALHDKIANLAFLDPACGSGNFLVVAYRELRRLEHKIVEATLENTALVDVRDLLRVRVEQFYGIEVDDFPAQIARTAMWLTDHQMNLEASRRLGTAYTRLPLTDGAHIVHANALSVPWNDVISAAELDYIFGNPPFLGSRKMSIPQKSELKAVAKGYPQVGFLDYVVAWYILTDRMMEENPAIEAAFVSTNSISQGEQPGIFWPKLYKRGCHINFAHRTFRWTNAAKGVAAVHCVVVGFSRNPWNTRMLFEYPELTGEPVLRLVNALNPYLIEGDEHVVTNRQQQISDQPKMSFGNMPADGGHLLLTLEERQALERLEPEAACWILPCVGAKEFIQRIPRFALWLKGITPAQIRAMPQVRARVAAIKAVREKSARPQLAAIPHLFAQITQDPHEPFLLVPSVSSENREYVPMGFYDGGTVATNLCLTIEGARREHFAILTSRMHMDWLRTVGGRLKSDLRYSKDVVYNNFPFPALADEALKRLAVLGQAVLDARALYPDSSLADLYDPISMPAELRQGHNAIDEYVDSLYQPGGFASSEERVRFLLRKHEKLTAPDAGP